MLTKRAVGELNHIKVKKAPGFRQPQLFSKVMTVLECHHFRLPVRRFVVDLFDKAVMRKIVLEEESSDEGLESSDESETGTERQRSIDDPAPPTTSG